MTRMGFLFPPTGQNSQPIKPLPQRGGYSGYPTKPSHAKLLAACLLAGGANG